MAVGKYLAQYSFDLPPENLFNASNRGYPDVAFAASDIALIVAAFQKTDEVYTAQADIALAARKPAKVGSGGGGTSVSGGGEEGASSGMIQTDRESGGSGSESSGGLPLDRVRQLSTKEPIMSGGEAMVGTGAPSKDVRPGYHARNRRRGKGVSAAEQESSEANLKGLKNPLRGSTDEGEYDARMSKQSSEEERRGDGDQGAVRLSPLGTSTSTVTDPGTDPAGVKHYLTESSGTSYSAHLFAGMIALINDERLTSGKGTVGFINPVLYGLHRTAADVFHDVKEGSSKCPHPKMTGDMVGCCENGFRAGKGWDPLTGLGSVDFQRLKDELLKLP